MTEPDADVETIDRLYAGAAGSDLDGLRMVRGLVARVRDEMPGLEPPQAISARLLQAAEPAPAAVAAVEPDRPSLWARMRTWFAQPAVAALAMLVLVAGGAAIWMRQGKSASPAISTTEVDDESKEEAVADLPAETRGSTVTLPPEQRAERPVVKPEPEKPADKRPAPPRVTTHVGGESSPPPPPPPPSDETTVTPDSVHGDVDHASQLTKQAIAAAKKGDCATVAKIAEKVHALDAEYYAATFVVQADIRGCTTVSK